MTVSCDHTASGKERMPAILLNMDPELKDAAKAVASRRSMSTSAWIRKAMVRAIDAESDHAHDPDRDEMLAAYDGAGASARRIMAAVAATVAKASGPDPRKDGAARQPNGKGISEYGRDDATAGNRGREKEIGA